MAWPESIQDLQEKNRPSRVNLKFKVHKDGAEEEKEIPFVFGVMADLSGHRTEPPEPLGSDKRAFELVDRDNFDSYMASVKPRLDLTVPNRLEDDGTKVRVSVEFRSLDDFGPERLVQNVPKLKELLETRRKLAELKHRIGGNDKAEDLVKQIIENTISRKGTGSSVAAPVSSPATEEPQS